MNVKRKLPETASRSNKAKNYIDISSDEEDLQEPKPKRQKSVSIDENEGENLLRSFVGRTQQSQPRRNGTGNVVLSEPQRTKKSQVQSIEASGLPSAPAKTRFQNQPTWLVRSPAPSQVTSSNNGTDTKRSVGTNGLSKRVQSIDLTYSEDENEPKQVRHAAPSMTQARSRSTRSASTRASSSTPQVQLTQPKHNDRKLGNDAVHRETSTTSRETDSKSKYQSDKPSDVAKSRLDVEGIRTKPSRLLDPGVLPVAKKDKEHARTRTLTDDIPASLNHIKERAKQTQPPAGQTELPDAIVRKSHHSSKGDRQPTIAASPRKEKLVTQADDSDSAAANFRLSSPHKIQFNPRGNDPITALMNEKRSLTSDQPRKSQNFQLNIPPSQESRPRPTSQASQPRPQTPRKSNIEVIIPSPSVDSAALLAQFSQRKPDPFVIRQQKRAMMERMKKDTSIVETHMDEIEKLFGQFGFSKTYPTNLDDERMTKAAQPKKRKVDRSKIKLDCGDPPPLPTGRQITNPREEALRVLTKRFDEPINPSLTFSNTLNDRRIYGKFQFVSSYIIRAGVKVAAEERNYGCRCVGTCTRDTCACLEKVVEKKKGKPHSIENRSKSRSPDICPEVYVRHPDGLVTLTPTYIAQSLDPLADRFEITECNDKCPCPPTCINRVVQHGRTVPLEIFMTERTGFGVRSSVDIRAGQFIDLYLGEVITTSELERRETAKEESASSYVYSLDWFTKHSGSMYHVDGEIFGTAMRFINHSCVPNARSFVVLKHHADKSLYDLAFFAIRDIKAGTEIRIDYSPQEAGRTREENEIEGGGMEGTECLCGEKECRGRLWRECKVRRRKRKIVPS